MRPIIEARGISKAYQIGSKSERYLSLRDSLASPRSWFSGVPTETFFALNDISFDILPGEAVGIIGKNGAGKSTLLKILSRITPPTSGSIKLRGRVASLLEVGTGFHPELTGSENIFFNGAILGMRKVEIQGKFDEIVDFSGVEQFLDTPLKKYSSGMQLRLAFAVAAHLDPEILLIDEVLAVGDAAFQKKCLGKMEAVSRLEGKTVVVVSHDLGIVESLCKKVMVLQSSKIELIGTAHEAIKFYQSSYTNPDFSFNGPLAKAFSLKQISINGQQINNSSSTSLYGQPLVFELTFFNSGWSRDFRITLSIFQKNMRIFTLHDSELISTSGSFVSTFSIPANLLRLGIYDIAIGGHGNDMENEWFWNASLHHLIVAGTYADELESINLGIINVIGNNHRTNYDTKDNTLLLVW